MSSSEQFSAKLAKQNELDDKRTQILDGIIGTSADKTISSISGLDVNRPTSSTPDNSLFEIIKDEQDEFILKPEPHNAVQNPGLAPTLTGPAPTHAKGSTSNFKVKTSNYANGEDDEHDDDSLNHGMYKQPSDPTSPQPVATSINNTTKSRQQPQLQSTNSCDQKTGDNRETSFGGFFSNLISSIFDTSETPKPQRMARVRNDDVIGLLFLTFSILDYRKKGCIKKDLAYKHYVALYYYTNQVYQQKGLVFDKETWDSKKDDFMDALIAYKPSLYNEVIFDAAFDNEESVDEYVDCESWRFYIQDYYLDDDAMFKTVLQMFIDNEGAILDKKRNEIEQMRKTY